jgi:hypothetical protein
MRTLLAVTIQFDYSFDTSNFFDTQAKKDLLQFAANSVANNLNNTLSAIAPSGVNTWSATFLDPSSTTGKVQAVNNLVVPANTLIIYVGGANLSGAEKGSGGPGGFSWSGTPDWGATVEGRGQVGATQPNPTVFSAWGGAISFQQGATDWYFGTSPSGLGATQVDFLSVATHELGHVLGIGDNIQGQQTAWSRYVSGSTFVGPNAEAAHGGTPVPLDAAHAHWAQGTMSGGVEAVMTPILLTGTRKLMTPLDYAGLQDLGWNVQLTNTVQMTAQTYYVSDLTSTVTLTLSRVSAANSASVVYTTSDGTAKAGTNYTATTQTLSFAPGEFQKSFTIPILNDNLTNIPNKTFHVSLSNFAGFTAGPITTSTVLIIEGGRTGPAWGDFDGDGTTDAAVFEPSTSTFYISRSHLGNEALQFGIGTLFGGHPVNVSADYDGDGIIDPAVFEPSTSTFYIHTATGNRAIQFGIGTRFGGHPVPVPGNYQGDGIIDPAVFEPSTSTFYIAKHGAPNQAIQFGIGTLFGGHPVPVPNQFEADSITDPAVFEPSTATFYIAKHNAPNQALQFGIGTLFGGHPQPIPGNYEGDSIIDPAVFEPSTATFYISNHNGPNQALQFGIGTLFGGSPVVASATYEGDGVTDPAVFEPSTATFYIARHSAPNQATQFGIGSLFGGSPVVSSSDFQGDTTTDPAVFEPSTSTFYIAKHNAPNAAVQFGIGTLFGGHPVPISSPLSVPASGTVTVRSLGTVVSDTVPTTEAHDVASGAGTSSPSPGSIPRRSSVPQANGSQSAVGSLTLRPIQGTPQRSVSLHDLALESLTETRP